MPHRLPLLLMALAGFVAPAGAAPPELGQFVERYCVNCHVGPDAEGGLDLDALLPRAGDPTALDTWVKIHDRIQSGEMPPAEWRQPKAEEREALTHSLAGDLRNLAAAKRAYGGRVQYRRLNRTQYEDTLRDLLHLPQLDVAGMLPPDGRAHGFDTVGAALDLSPVQMARYLDAATAALDKATVLTAQPEVEKRHLLARESGRLAASVRNNKEAVRIGEAVGLLRQPNTAQAPWWWDKFEPPADGTYRLRVKMFGFVWDKGTVKPADRTHVVTYEAVLGTTKRSLDTFDISRSPTDPSIHEFTTFLRRGEELQFWLETLDDRNKGKTPMEEYSAPGVAVEWLEVEGPLTDQWPPASTRALFGDLPVARWTPATGLAEPQPPLVTVGVGKRARPERANRKTFPPYHVVSNDPTADARRLLADFASRVFRRPVDPADLADYLALVQAKIDQKLCFQEAMRVGFQAVLCSPEFLFLAENPGHLDQPATAARLSYFLWNSAPDAELSRLARGGRLDNPDELRRQVERLLNDPKSARFVENFAGQWLDLRRIAVTEPDARLYPEYDRFLLDSMTKETLAFFTEMLRRDLGADHLVASDFVMANGRLAELYGLVGVNGSAIRPVKLPPGSPRGGLLTQASVLKVTANGTSTSPVTRGAWVLDRLLGQPAPPPPPGTPAVEPDLRGTTTIRQQLAKHRESTSCAVCHNNIDPPGFALESFDVIGGFRENYRAIKADGPGTKSRAGYQRGPVVDPSGVAPGGSAFADIHGFRQILLAQEEQLARNLAGKLLIYSTGAGLDFADRQAVDDILERTREQNHGLRSLIHAIVQSETFRSK